MSGDPPTASTRDDLLWDSVVISVERDGNHSELRFLTQSPDKATKLLESVQSFLKEVDVERGRIELDLPEGLLEACASGS